MPKVSYREQADQALRETLAHYAANPLPASHQFAMNPANQPFLNCSQPYKKIPLFGKTNWQELILDIDDDYSTIKSRPPVGLVVNFLAAILALAFAIGAAWWILNTFNLNSLLARDGVVAEAKVVDRYTRDSTHRTSSGSSRTDRNYYLTFELTYTDASGQPQVLRRTESVSPAVYNGHKVGGLLQVIYYPADPSKFLISGTGSDLGMNLLLMLAAIPLCLAAAVYQLWQFAAKSGKRRRLKKGQFLIGRITACEVKNNLFGKPKTVSLAYRFTGPAGQLVTGQKNFPAHYFKGRWRLLEADKPLTVLYQNEKVYEVL